MIQIKQIHSNEVPNANDLSTNDITQSDVLIVDDNGTLYVTYIDSDETLKAKPIKAVYNTVSAIGSSSEPVFVNEAGQIEKCDKINEAAYADNATNATIAEKLGSSDVGATNQLMYLDSGTPTGGIKILAGDQEPPTDSSIPNGSIYIKY